MLHSCRKITIQIIISATAFASSCLAQSSLEVVPENFYFTAIFGSTEIKAQEITGLDTETQIFEYRASNSKTFSTIKMPGLKKYGTVTLKRIVFPSENDYLQWYNQVKLNNAKTVINATITLHDYVGNAQMIWVLHNARPTKITSTIPSDIKNGVFLVNSIEVIHEGITVANK